MTRKFLPGKESFLKDFGQPERASVCACERTQEASLAQSLQLMSGSFVQKKIGRAHLIYKGSPREQVELLYLSAYSRMPTSKERAIAEGYLKKSKNPRQAISNLLWSIINSNEFMFQH